MSEIRKDFDIESEALDVEWLRQPRLRLKYGELSAETKKNARDLKQKVKQVSAEISKEVRERGGKVTDSLITMSIELDPRYQEAVSALSQAMYEDDIISGRLDAVTDKKVALENEVRMWIGNYFAGPTTPRDLKKEFEPSGISAEIVREKLLDHARR
ncbi:MAG: hypothetical protein GY853_01430 [PVC group bacterium]|nr:hypothetical protein [PVC group bacterium]